MKTIVGVRFRHTGKSYYFDPGELELTVGTPVIVRAGDGLEYGRISIPPLEREEDKLPAIVKQIVRIATEEDEAIVEENRRREEDAYRICKIKIAELGLPMKLIHAEYTFERNKLLFYFSAEGRVDFRELVRLLATEFRTRIELRQIGVRDETKMLGGIGICGRELCCNTYLSGFTPVSIKMAKEQNLSLNPTKISGVCGRLMCCLSHEEEVYEYLNRTMPKSGDYATNVEGQTGVIRSVNILKQSVLVLFEDGDTREMKEYPVSEVGLSLRREGVPSPEKVEKIQQELEELFDKKREEELSLLRERQVQEDPDMSLDAETTDSRDGRDNYDKQGGRRRRKNGDRSQEERANSKKGRSGGRSKDRNGAEGRNGSGNRNRSNDQGKDRNEDRSGGQGRNRNEDRSGGQGKVRNEDRSGGRSKDRNGAEGRNGSGNRNRSNDQGKSRNADRSGGQGKGRNAEKAGGQGKGRNRSADQGKPGSRKGGKGKKGNKDAADNKSRPSKNAGRPNKPKGNKDGSGGQSGRPNGGYSRGY